MSADEWVTELLWKIHPIIICAITILPPTTAGGLWWW